MKNLFLIAFVLIAVSVSAQNEDGIKKRLQNKYVQFLKEEGFMPSIDDDGDVKFKFEGKSYYINPYGKQPLYFSLKRYLNHENGGCSTDIRKAVNKAAGAKMSVSVYLIGDECNLVVIESGNYLNDEDNFKDIFYKCLKAVKGASQTVIDEYNN